MKKKDYQNRELRKNFTLSKVMALFLFLGVFTWPVSASPDVRHGEKAGASSRNADQENVLHRILRQAEEKERALEAVPQQDGIQASGRVVSVSGEELIGVTVIIKGTTTGVATDVNGRFTMRVPKDAILVFSYVGYNNKEMAAGKDMQVVLEENQQELDEVMVVAYGTARKSSFTGSAAVVKKDVLEKAQVSSLSKALQGISAGVQANAASGQPGTDADIRIRGIGSINASASPLYVVDGVPYEGSLNSINPADIESMTVLKDAASSALYGSRGANGVIVITTKQGSKEAEPTVNFRLSYGVSNRAVKDYEHVSTNQYFELLWEAIRNNRLDNNLSEADAAAYASENLFSGVGINPYGEAYPEPIDHNGKFVEGATPLWDDDWVDALSQKARRLEAQLSVSGGTKRTKYFISGGYLDDQGIALASGFKRYTGRVNLTSDVKKWLTVGGNVSMTHSVQDYPVSSDSKTSNVINFGRLMPSFYPVYQRDGQGNYILKDGEKQIDWGSYRSSSAMRNMNLVGSLPYDKNEIKRDAATLRAFLELNLYKGLKFKTSLNVDYNNRNEHYYTNPLYGSGTSIGGSVTKENYRSTGMTFNNILSYSNTFNEVHSVSGLLGQE
ncbi:MAG: SusC/RagA family TonB-linked outer membrane protein, partial [Odoribacter sp.]|nr:SusC/RagA family TonB-linked outer membrane protein [Odoribacter sp.]